MIRQLCWIPAAVVSKRVHFPSRLWKCPMTTSYEPPQNYIGTRTVGQEFSDFVRTWRQAIGASKMRIGPPWRLRHACANTWFSFLPNWSSVSMPYFGASLKSGYPGPSSSISRSEFSHNRHPATLGYLHDYGVSPIFLWQVMGAWWYLPKLVDIVSTHQAVTFLLIGGCDHLFRRAPEFHWWYGNHRKKRRF